MDGKYKISSEGELKEVKWLIKDGTFKSIEDYENSMTKALIEVAAHKKALRTASRKKVHSVRKAA